VKARLRAAHGEEELARIYAAPHRHELWPAHAARVQESIRLGRELFRHAGYPAVIADLSCGDAAIARALASPGPGGQPPRVILGDLAPGYELHGPVEQTLHQLDHAGLLICTETIEHLDDPEAVLALARVKAAMLLLSTPAGERDNLNPEHYWGWDQDDIGEMLAGAGWTPVLQRDVSWTDENQHPWVFQIWGAL